MSRYFVYLGEVYIEISCDNRAIVPVGNVTKHGIDFRYELRRAILLLFDLGGIYIYMYMYIFIYIYIHIYIYSQL